MLHSLKGQSYVRIKKTQKKYLRLCNAKCIVNEKHSSQTNMRYDTYIKRNGKKYKSSHLRNDSCSNSLLIT